MSSPRMQRRRISWPAATAAALVVLLAASGCGASAETAAEISGAGRSAQYTVGELTDYLATVDPDNEARAPRAAAADWLTDWVFFSAVELELADRGVTVTNEHESRSVNELTLADPEFVPGAAGGDVAIRQRAVVFAAAQWAEQEVPAPPVSAAAAGLRYLCSRHILVESRQDAELILEQLAAGADFAVLASLLSLDAASGSRGGDLGCAPEGSFVAPFEEAGYNAELGEPVLAETQFGFHVIDVAGAGPPTPENHPHLDDAALEQLAANAEAAVQQAAQAAVQSERQRLLVDLQEAVLTDYASRVKIDERYGYWDPEQFVVVAAPPG
ncbi:MAG: peptidylprolyl isomerase [Acidimicrobiaceae bacterium]|nr:peptidylprolyl isomerase [Acidimicrobiaceae bacterium]MCY4294089.1 peptidylprolyl isomerase [Acidimicrobiaceae bacterium]